MYWALLANLDLFSNSKFSFFKKSLLQPVCLVVNTWLPQVVVQGCATLPAQFHSCIQQILNVYYVPGIILSISE